MEFSLWAAGKLRLAAPQEQRRFKEVHTLTRELHYARFKGVVAMIRPCLVAAGVFSVVGSAQAVFAQAVQLPSFHYFGVSTTVSVPDRGAAYLGGVSRASSGSVGRGIPLVGKVPGLGRLGRNQAIGSSLGTSGVSVTATIIDHDALDKAVLAEARARRAGGPAADAAAEIRVRFPDAAPVGSVADIRRQNDVEDAVRRQESLELIAKGRQAEAAGKASVAKVYYEMAARRADEALRQQIEEHLAALLKSQRVAANR